MELTESNLSHLLFSFNYDCVNIAPFCLIVVFIFFIVVLLSRMVNEILKCYATLSLCWNCVNICARNQTSDPDL
jgi:hypothetical protein